MRNIIGLITLLMLGACTLLPFTDSASLPVSDNAAVLELFNTARAAMSDGKNESAAAALERALRIEPRNPGLWHQLAQVRLQQGQAGNAAALAAKSNVYASDNKRIQIENWRLIGEARSSQGDYFGAEAAFAQAETLEQKFR